jgi:uncharacterized protein with ACT and thioredoxin-like domain
MVASSAATRSELGFEVARIGAPQSGDEDLRPASQALRALVRELVTLPTRSRLEPGELAEIVEILREVHFIAILSLAVDVRTGRRTPGFVHPGSG